MGKKLPKIETTREFLVQSARGFAHKYEEPNLTELIVYLLLKMRVLHGRDPLEKEEWRYLTHCADCFTDKYDDEGMSHFILELFSLIERLYDQEGENNK